MAMPDSSIVIFGGVRCGLDILILPQAGGDMLFLDSDGVGIAGRSSVGSVLCYVG